MTDNEQIIHSALVNQLSPEQMLTLTPSPELQVRVSLLLRYSKERCLSLEEKNELEKYLALEHQIRMAKAYAYQQLASSTFSKSRGA